MHYLGEVKTFIILCGKYIQDNVYQMLSESTGVCGRYDKNILVCFSVHSVGHPDLLCSVVRSSQKIRRPPICVSYMQVTALRSPNLHRCI